MSDDGRRDRQVRRVAARLSAVLDELREVIEEMRGAAETEPVPAPEPGRPGGEEEGNET